tara:strand:- start:425 stop:610 length:186 start_codon:yes stop_codon:yes gene_type:complete
VLFRGGLAPGTLGFGGSMLFLGGGVGKVFLSTAVIYLLLYDVVVLPYLPLSAVRSLFLSLF